jgi:hypothetical protein
MLINIKSIRSVATSQYARFIGDNSDWPLPLKSDTLKSYLASYSPLAMPFVRPSMSICWPNVLSNHFAGIRKVNQRVVLCLYVLPTLSFVEYFSRGFKKLASFWICKKKGGFALRKRPINCTISSGCADASTI